MSAPLAPGATIGVLGGGQLGRMLALAAARLGLKVHIFAPEGDAPACAVSAAATRADYTDEAALAAFAAAVDVATTEFENVPAAAAEFLAARLPMRPGPKALAIAQDRLAEKMFLNGVDATTAPFRAIDGPGDLRAAFNAFEGAPAILKTRRLGYDGKGQTPLVSPSPDAWAEAYQRAGGGALIIEKLVAFEREISVVAARGADGRVVCFDPAENEHEHGILRESRVPARISEAIHEEAARIAGRILTALDYVGVIGVEFFVDPKSPTGLLVNEIAPRVHNTGHWTQDACAVDQFEQHIRAVAGWPLGDGGRAADARMRNLLGEEALGWERRALAPGARLHLYGKAEARPGRKMGHLTEVSPRAWRG